MQHQLRTQTTKEAKYRHYPGTWMYGTEPQKLKPNNKKYRDIFVNKLFACTPRTYQKNYSSDIAVIVELSTSFHYDYFRHFEQSIIDIVFQINDGKTVKIQFKSDRNTRNTFFDYPPF